MNVFGVGFNPGAEGFRPELPELRVSPTSVGKVSRVQDPTRDLDARLANSSSSNASASSGPGSSGSGEEGPASVEEPSERHQEAARANRDSVDISFQGDLGQHIEVRFKGADGRETTVEVQNGLAVPLRSMRLDPPEFPKEREARTPDEVQLDFTRPEPALGGALGETPREAAQEEREAVEASRAPVVAEPARSVLDGPPVEARRAQARRAESNEIERLEEVRQVELPFESPGPGDEPGGLVDFRV